MLHPLIPMVCDAWSHTFANAYHIATVHAKFGSRHLEKSLAKSSDSANKEKNSIKAGESPTVHIFINEYYPSIKYFHIPKLLSLEQGRLVNQLVRKHIPPPKASC